jgi:hypothetical protein
MGRLWSYMDVTKACGRGRLFFSITWNILGILSWAESFAVELYYTS